MVISIQAIHSLNVLHRDLKTQNIMLDRTQKTVKIGDFGISKVLSSKSKASTVVGTPCYISPELCEGKPYNEKSDIWALGCVLYEMVTLRRAFDAPNLPALVLKIMRATFEAVPDSYSEDLRKLILSTLHLDPNMRPGLGEILALPICQNALMELHTDIGRVPCLRRELDSSRSGAGTALIPAGRRGSAQQARRSQRPSRLSASTESEGAPPEFGGVAFFGGGHTTLRRVEALADLSIAGLAVSRTEQYAVLRDGRVLGWKPPRARPGSAMSAISSAPQRIAGLKGVVRREAAHARLFVLGRLGCCERNIRTDVPRQPVLGTMLCRSYPGWYAGPRSLRCGPTETS